MLVKTQTVLELQEDDYGPDDARVYSSPNGRETMLALDVEMYRDLSSPLHITVTIEPGDLLN